MHSYAAVARAKLGEAGYVVKLLGCWRAYDSWRAYDTPGRPYTRAGVCNGVYSYHLGGLGVENRDDFLSRGLNVCSLVLTVAKQCPERSFVQAQGSCNLYAVLAILLSYGRRCMRF